MKHFVAHGQYEYGLNYSSPNTDERRLGGVLPIPFMKSVQQGNVFLAMASYKVVNGVPVHANS
jgi:beta-glucosidase-like glycosyl hydrolase